MFLGKELLVRPRVHDYDYYERECIMKMTCHNRLTNPTIKLMWIQITKEFRWILGQDLMAHGRHIVYHRIHL